MDGVELRPVVHRLLHPQPGDRILLRDVAADEQQQAALGDRRQRPAQAPRHLQAGAARAGVEAVVQVRGPHDLAEDAPQQEVVLVGQPGAAQHPHAAGAALPRLRQARGHEVERLVPGRLHQLSVLADQRTRQAVLGVQPLEAELAEVAEPDVVQVRRLPRAHARDGLVAYVQPDRAPQAAVVADRGHRVVVPGPGLEAIGAAGQRADGTDGDRVADELGAHRLGERRVDLGLEPALEALQRIVAGDDLTEAHAAPAEDAAFAVQHQHRSQRDRLGEVALQFDEPAAAGAVGEGLVLQRALPALVADGTVQRVVDQEELQVSLLGPPHVRRRRGDDHALFRDQRAGGLQPRHLLHADETLPAGAQRRHAVQVAEDGDVDAGLLRRMPDRGAAGHRDGAPVDGQRDGGRGLSHGASAPAAPSARFPT